MGQLGLAVEAAPGDLTPALSMDGEGRGEALVSLPTQAPYPKRARR